VATLEHRRFAEFCDACRRYGYIGLCFGSSGVGKTLSASSYSGWENVREIDRWSSVPLKGPIPDTILYTPSVVNTPRGIDADITRSRATLRDLATRPERQNTQEKLDDLHQRDKEHLWEHEWSSGPLPELYPTYEQLSRECATAELNIADPTTLLVIDEADRLRRASLEQVRSIFDGGRIGLVLIGMPGLEKRLARYPQFYSRIGFVHEFRPLGAVEIRQLLAQGWMPIGVCLPEQPWAVEATAAIIRITGGNFRLLNRLLTQMERILEINALQEVTKAVVEAARETLVIGET